MQRNPLLWAALLALGVGLATFDRAHADDALATSKAAALASPGAIAEAVVSADPSLGLDVRGGWYCGRPELSAAIVRRF